MQYLLHFKVLNNEKVHNVWISENAKVQSFLEDVQKSWNVDDSLYDHFFYHCEMKRVVNKKKSWKQNKVLPGDHLILL